MKKYTLLFLCFVVIQSYAQTTRYVKADATGANNGSSWTNAYTNFQTAVNAASVGDDVWVAAGTYQPASGQTFAMKEGVKIYGGFVGNEGTLGARNWTANVTILQGNGSYVIKNELNGLTNAAVLDGFTVTGGSAVVAGAGMYNAKTSPTVINCTFSGNTATYGGGAIYNYQCPTPPLITNCIFSNNNGATYGGAIYNVVSSPIITGCTFNNNTAATGGGVYYNNQSVPNISHCMFKNNVASTAAGGAIYYNGSGVTANAYISSSLFTGNTSNAGSAIGYGDQAANNLIITNCTFYNNTGSAAVYARFWNAGLRPIIFNNSIVYGNAAFFGRTANGGEIQVNYSLIQDASCPVGGTCNASVIYNQDPKFVDAASGNFALRVTSPAVNKGDNSLNGDASDLTGQPRSSGNNIDLGAYEFQSADIMPDGSNILYVDMNVQSGDGSGTNWANAIPQLADALKWARQQNNFTTVNPLKIYVAKGTYKPLYSAVDGSNYANGGKDNAFVMVKNVQLYGGFDPGSGNTNINTRVLPTAANEFPANGTVLSGDVNDNDVLSISGDILSITNNTENNYHVLVSIGDVETAVLDGFTIKGGSANSSYTETVINTVTVPQGSGGGLYNRNSSPTLANCVFTGNLANLNGGSIYNHASNSVFTNCVMSKSLGYYYGGGVYNFSSYVTLVNCTIKLNLHGPFGTGGGMANYSSVVMLNDCAINGNSAVNGAGMINSGSTLTLNNCNISGNKVMGNSGGALYNSTSTVRLFNCTLNGNSVTNSSYASGGAISNSSCPLVQITNCTISGNTVNGTNTRGSGIYNLSSTNVLLVNSAIIGNNTPNDAAGTDLYNISTSPKLMNTTLANNGAGGVYSDADSTPEFQNSIIWGTVSGNYTANYSLIKGSAVTSNGNIDGSSVTSANIFTDDSNGIYTLKNSSPAVGTGSNSLYEAFDGDVNNSSLSNDKDLDGNDRLQKGTIDLGAFESSYNYSITITPDANGVVYVKQNGAGNFTGNSWINAAPELADVLKAAKTNTAIHQIWVAAGTYKPLYSPADNNFGNADGRNNAFLLVSNVKIYGGFAGTETSLLQRDLTIVGNKSILSGDFNNDDVVMGNGATLSITGNSENAYHVVISINNVNGAELNGFTIKGGNANAATNIVVGTRTIIANLGGGLRSHTSSPTLTNLSLVNNSASSDGGAMYNTSSLPNISNTNFSANSAVTGAAMYNLASSLSIGNTVFSGNSAQSGGAIVNISSSTIIDKVTFSSNFASFNGGALFNNNSSPVISNSSFTGNLATNNGGAMYNLSLSPKINSTTFTGNTAGGYGGAIFSNGSSPMIYSSLLVNNTAQINGGGIWLQDATNALLQNCTLYGNTANGSNATGLYINNGSVNVYNSLFWDNSAQQYTTAGTGVINLSYSLIKGNTNTANHNLDASGLSSSQIFTDAANYDFTLKNTSPAINKGSNALYTALAAGTKDLSANARVFNYASNGTIDIGAYEYQGVLTTSLSNFANINKVFGEADFTLTAPTTNSDGAFSYTSSDEHVATINGHTVTIVGVGSTTITAAQAATGDYTAGSISLTLTVDKAGQTISFAALANKTYGDGDFNLNATGGASGNVVTYSSSNPLVATVSGNMVTIVGVGSTTITASQVGNANYDAAADVPQTLAVDKAGQTISFAALANKTYGDADFSLNATGGASGNTVTYSSSNPLVATVSGNTVTIVGAGSTTITASQLGNANYNAATDVPQSLTVGKVGQTISFAALANKTYGDADFSLNATGGASGNTVTYSSSNLSVATVSGNTVTIVGAGSTTITASQVGNANYDAAADVPQTLTVDKAGQTISFAALISKTYGDVDFNLTATGGASGNALTYSSSNPLVATVSGNTVTIVGAGSTTITASQVGNANYNAAADIPQTLTVDKATQSITFASLDPKTTASPDFALVANSSSGLSLNFSSSNSSVATVYQNGGVWMVKINGSGTTDIIASQSGDGNYMGATTRVQQLLVTEPPLPVNLLSYKANVDGNAAKLEWKTASEQNNKNFVIYRSGNDRAFVNIGEVQGKGTTSLANSYVFYDKQPLKGNNYYRLVQVDLNGKPIELGERVLNFEFSVQGIQLYPNPTKGETMLNFAAGKYTRLTVSSVEGKILNIIPLKPQDDKVQVDLAQYPVGLYFVRLMGVNESITKKVIKQ